MQTNESDSDPDTDTEGLLLSTARRNGRASQGRTAKGREFMGHYSTNILGTDIVSKVRTKRSSSYLSVELAASFSSLEEGGMVGLGK
jgi:hypothetical protein